MAALHIPLPACLAVFAARWSGSGTARVLVKAAQVVLLCLPPCAPAADLKLWTGGPPPALALNDLDGRAHRLADYRGKVVLINFWATWCGPCRDEMPSIQALKDKLSGRPFAVLAVNVNEAASSIRPFLSRMKVDFTVLLDPGRPVTQAWGVRVLPASFIVGPDGRIRYTLVGEINWDNEHIVARISELLPANR